MVNVDKYHNLEQMVRFQQFLLFTGMFCLSNGSFVFLQWFWFVNVKTVFVVYRWVSLLESVCHVMNWWLKYYQRQNQWKMAPC